MKKVCPDSELEGLKSMASNHIFFHCFDNTARKFCAEVGRTNMKGLDHVVLSLLCLQTAVNLCYGYSGNYTAPADYFHEAVAIEAVNGSGFSKDHYDDLDDALDHLERNNVEFNNKLQQYLDTTEIVG